MMLYHEYIGHNIIVSKNELSPYKDNNSYLYMIRTVRLHSAKAEFIPPVWFIAVFIDSITKSN